jgi:hypothetical protein
MSDLSISILSNSPRNGCPHVSNPTPGAAVELRVSPCNPLSISSLFSLRAKSKEAATA